MEIRTFKGTDIDGIVEVWNGCMPENTVTRHIFVKNFLLDRNFDENGFFVAEDEKGIAGFIYAIVKRFPADVGASLDETKGYINAIGIRDSSDSKMKERGLDKARAQATPNSGAARAVYDKAGFETIGEYITFKKSNTKE